MKFRTRFTKLLLICIVASITAIGLMAWTGKPVPQLSQNVTDTIPSKKVQKEKPKKDFDKQLEQLEKVETELGSLDHDDLDDLGEKIEEAIGRIDFGRIGLEIEEATHDLKDLDKEIARALKDVNWDEISVDIEKSMKELRDIDFENIHDELHDAKRELKSVLKDGDWDVKLDNINWKEINDDIAKSMKDVKDFKFDFDAKDLDIGLDMENVTGAIRKAKEELKGFKEMVYEMEQDKLLNTENDYKIEFKKGELYIDDKKQGAEITSKYKKYFPNDRTIIKKNGNININPQSGTKRVDVEPA